MKKAIKTNLFLNLAKLEWQIPKQMKSLKYIFFFILIIVIGTSIYIATLDGNYSIRVSRTMKVPSEVIFKNISDYKNWKKWGPWFEIDKSIVTYFSETTSGIGSSFTWTGQNGLGSLKTISLIPNKEIIQEIENGSDSNSEMLWQLNELKDSTQVIWELKGKNSFREKIHWLINGGIELNTKPLYERGLVLLEQELLKEMDLHSTEYKGVVDYGGGFYLYKTVACRNDEVADKTAEMFPSIFEYMTLNKIEALGKPFTLNHKIDTLNNTVLFSTCVPIKERIITEEAILTGYLAPTTTFKIAFNGHYKFLPNLWPEFYKTLASEGYTPVEKGHSFEFYTVGPKENRNPAEWLTEIYIPIIVQENEASKNEIFITN